jgi:Carboxypeptidase regulatory-like domain/TonB dependent receptor
MSWGSYRARGFSRLILLGTILLLPRVLLAQSFRGSIRGKVTDPSGSVVPGAKVNAKNLNTGINREALTTDEGTYVLAELPVGSYTVTVTAGGFAEVAQNIVVNVGLDTTADFALLLEKQTQVITVHEEAPVVDTTRDVLGQVVDQRLVTELPLNGRDFGKLVALTPGTTVDPSGVAGAQASFGQFNINGNRDRSNNYTLDGTDNNDPFLNNSALNQVGIGGAPASLLPIDAIQEFNLQAAFGAEYGRNSGSVVNIVTKSGSNRLHGSGFEFLRNSGLDARNYFNTESKKSVFQNNNFGASLGGPIVKDKTFFFGAYEGQRERVGSDFLLLVPTPTQIQQARAIAAPLNGGVINPGLDKILAFYPVSTTGQIADATRDTNNGDNVIVKVDHNFTTSELLTGRYAFSRNYQVFPFGSPGGYGAGSRLPQFAQTSPTRVQVVSASLLSTLTATKINEVRFGYSRYRTSFSSLDANFNPQTALGLNFGTGKLGLPEFDFTGIENLGATGFSIPRGRTSGTYQILDNFTWLQGKHAFKFGGEFRRAVVDNFNDNLERGIFQFTAGVGLSPDPVVDALADFYTAGNQDVNFCCSFVSVDAGNTERTTYNNGFSFFGQDDYRILSHLTLNLGLRWEYFGPLSEAHNLLSNLGQDGQLAMVGSDGLNGLYHRDLGDFAPRFGFAWSALKNTVVRGGYGIYYDYVPQDLFIANYTTSAGVATNPLGPEPVLPMNFNAGAFNGTSPGPIMTPVTVQTGGPFNVFVTPPNFRSPYSENWNLNVQQKLVENASLEVGYVGSKGTRLVRLTDLNEPDANGNRPNGGFQAIDQLAPSSSSTYHALQAIARIQDVHRFSGFASYVWSKSLDYASDGIDFVPGAAFPQDPSNLAAEHGPSLFDTRNRFTAALNYELPDWRSLEGLGKGWQLNSIVGIQSGKPIPIANATDTSGRYYYNQRPDVVPGVNPILPHWSPTTGYLNPLAFIQPAYGTFGNLGRDAIYGPGYRNWDFSITKITRISERLSLQLRAEFFNILNHPNFALPAHTIIPGLIDNGTPGNPQIAPNPAAYVNGNLSQGLLPMAPITQTPDVAQTNPGLGGGGPRVIQLGAKFLF